MPIQIKSGQSFTDTCGIVHTTAYGKITYMIIDTHGRKGVAIRVEIYISEAIADLGNSDALIHVFQTDITQDDYDTYFAESVLLLVGKSTLTQAELAIMDKETSPGVKLIDDAVWEVA